MAARIDRKQARATIEKIRQSIDTGLAIKTLAQIMGNHKTPPTVRVKAAAVLLDKTMPSLTASEITQIDEQTSPLELLEQLKPMLGQDVYERLLEMYQPVSMDS